MQRRNFMEGVAAIAASNWDDLDYHPDEADEWGEFDGGPYNVLDPVSAAALAVDVQSQVASLNIQGETTFDERTVSVFYYDPMGVAIEWSADGDGGLKSNGAVYLDTERAKEVAGAIYQAAVELESWREADNGDN